MHRPEPGFAQIQRLTPWQPGMPVRTAEDHSAWRSWRLERKREQQRARRAKYRRIDYYPDECAKGLIDSLGHRSVGGDYSSVINRIIGAWIESGLLLPPE